MKGILNPFVRYVRIIAWGTRDKKVCVGEDCRLFYGISHECHIIMDKSRYSLKPGDILYLPGHSRYILDPKCDPDTHFLSLNFDLTETQSYYETPIPPIIDPNEPYKLPTQPILFPPFDREIYLPHMQKFEEPLHEILMKFQTKGRYYKEFSSAILKQILLEIAIESGEQEHYSAPILKAQRYIQLHYMENITNMDIALAVGYHHCYLAKLFKEETGKTLKRALIDHRLQISREMLLSSKHPISQIAEECGFANSSHFGEAFRTAFGQTPGEYREQYKEVKP